jgi:RNA 2',3'-cyclic 3'-phosphodiesterase
MRMFVALYPNDEARAHLTGTLGRLRGDHDAPALRWIPPERWHITLAFLAEVDPDRIDRLQASLVGVAAQQSPVDGLRLTGAGTFGPTVWVGVAPTHRGTPSERLAKAIQRACRTTGIEVEHRPWRAHLSIARVRTRDSDEAKTLTQCLVTELADYSGPAWTASGISLVHSILGPQPEHIPVGTFSLD